MAYSLAARLFFNSFWMYMQVYNVLSHLKKVLNYFAIERARQSIFARFQSIFSWKIGSFHAGLKSAKLSGAAYRAKSWLRFRARLTFPLNTRPLYIRTRARPACVYKYDDAKNKKERIRSSSSPRIFANTEPTQTFSSKPNPAKKKMYKKNKYQKSPQRNSPALQAQFSFE